MPGTTLRRTLRTTLAATAAATALVGVPAAQAFADVTAQPATTVLDGTVRMLLADADPAASGPAPGGGLGHVRTLVVSVGDRLVPLPAATAKGLRTGQRVRLAVATRWGTPAAAAVRALADPVPSAPRATLLAVTPTAVAPAVARTSVPIVGSRHTLVMLPITWTSATKPAIAQLTTSAQETAAFWTSQSNGRMHVDVDVRPWKTVPSSAALASCSSSALLSAALSANPGVTTSSTVHVVVWFPNLTSCGWAGLGGLGYSVVWNNGYTWSGVTTHEFGHNFGLGHANTHQCVDGSSWQISLSASCSDSEYGDDADVMGYGAWKSPAPDVNAAEADYLGLLDAVDVDPSAATTLVTTKIAPLSDRTGVRAVRIPLPARSPDLPEGSYLYLDYRTTTGYDHDWRGVQAHVMGGDRPWTWLLALRPDRSQTITTTTDWPSGWSDVTLGVGTTWRVPGTTLDVRVDAQDSTGATLTLSGSAPTDSLPPTVPRIVSAAQVNRLGTTVSGLRVTWQPATDAGTGVAGYSVTVDEAQVATTGSATSVTVPASALTAAPLAGTHTVVVTALDGSGNTASSSRTVLVDTTPPTAPALAVRRVDARHVALTWGAASDPQSGIASYQVLRAGLPLGVRQLPGRARYAATVAVPLGTTTVGVKVLDKAGLWRVVSARVTIR